MSEFKRTVETVEAYRDIVNHAEALGFEPVRHSFNGTWAVAAVKKPTNKTWTRRDNEPSWPSTAEVEGVTQKYFEVEMDGIMCRIEPDDSDSSLVVTFKD